jgi:hypothetical protein
VSIKSRPTSLCYESAGDDDDADNADVDVEVDAHDDADDGTKQLPTMVLVVVAMNCC